ncbi:MAG: Ada metal-binding domain-containing protein [Candidatus Xenobia bacterium]
MLTRDLMVARMLASDATFNGRFYTGVLSTGIYCLPSCRARKPRPDNVEFYPTPAAAEAAGLRPCKRCRPELHARGEDPETDAMERLADQVRRVPARYADVPALALAAGVGASKLHELFRRHYHTTPGAFLTQARVQAAATALRQSRAPVADIAFEVGFETLSSFNLNFRRLMAMAPSQYRRMGDDFMLQLPSDYPIDDVLAYLGRDPDHPFERVSGRSWQADWRTATVRVDFSPGVARVRGPAAMHERMVRALGLTWDVRGFRAGLQEPRLLALPALRIPLLTDPFDALCWVVVGQQISFAAAATLRRRLCELAGSPPDPARVAAMDATRLARQGFGARKGEYLVGLAQAMLEGRLSVENRSAVRAEQLLIGTRGLGRWSVRYLLMRSLGLADCAPVGDAALARSLQRFDGLPRRPTDAEVEDRMAAFSPHRSLATFYLWRWEARS